MSKEDLKYKQKYKDLKQKLRLLIYEQEYMTEELRKSQRKLLKLSRDKSFLLDRLLQYEQPDDATSEDDITASSDSDLETAPQRKVSSKKRKLTEKITLENLPAVDPQPIVARINPAQTPRKSKPRRKPQPAWRDVKTESTDESDRSKDIVGGMTREELDKHLASRPQQPDFVMVPKVTASVPTDIFGDGGDSDSDLDPTLGFV